MTAMAHGRALVALTLCAITVAMSFAQGVASRPLAGDNQLYFYMAERCASGTPPHLSQMEVKTQLPSLIGGAALTVGRVLGAGDIASGRTASVTAAWLVALLAWLLVERLTGSASAALVAGFATFAVRGIFVEAAVGFQPKLFMAVFVLAAHLLHAQRRHFSAGVAAVCAFLCWQPAAVVLAGIAVATLVEIGDRCSSRKHRAPRRDVARVAAGALLALLAYEMWFFVNGALQAQLHQEWALAFGSRHDPIRWLDSFRFVLTEAGGDHARPHVLPLVYLGAAAASWLWLLARPRQRAAVLRERPGLLAFWISSQLALAFTIYDHQAHPDLLLVQPYFVVAAGLAFGWLARLLGGFRAGRIATGVAAALLIAVTLQSAYVTAGRQPGIERELEGQLLLGKLVGLYHEHRGSVWALGPVHLLALNRLENWVSVGNVGHETREIDMKTWRPLRDGRMPEIILTGRGLKPGRAGWLNAEYVEITPVPMAMARVHVFSRRLGRSSGFDTGSAPKVARYQKR